MRALRIICLAATFHSISALSFDDGNYQNDKMNRRNVEHEVHEERSLEPSHYPALTTVVSHNRRNVITDPAGTHPSPTRHAKHRRRRRCKNRPACLESMTSKQRSVSRNYEHEPVDESLPSVTENDGGILVLRERAIASTPLPSRNGDAKRSIIANVTADDNSHVKRDQRTLAQNNDDGTTKSIYKTDTSNEYTEDEETISDTESETEDSKSIVLDSSKLEESEVYDENDFEDVYVSSWSDVKSSMGPRVTATTITARDSHTDAVYDAVLSSISVSFDSHFPFHNDTTMLLTKLSQTLHNVSAEDSRDILKELNLIANMDEDPCQKWLNSWDKFEQAFFGSIFGLPACPCQYPSSIFYNDKIWDNKQQKHFRWRDVSSSSQHLDVYKPGAAYCVRSLPAQGSGSAAAQHCCYDHDRRLLTRGSGAGTPNFISPEISIVLHERIDVLPWRLCKGDFSRFNKVRPPNNDNNCQTNPDDEEYQRQIDYTKYY